MVYNVSGDASENPRKIKWGIVVRNRYSVFYVFLVVAVGASVAFAQLGTGRVTGSAKDTAGEPIKGAVITATSAEGKTLEATSGSDGKWAILGLRSGRYDFNVTAEGYTPQNHNLQAKGRGRNPTMDFVLEPVAQAQGDGGTSMLGEANDMFANGQYAEALAKYEELLAAEAMTYEIHYNIGRVYRELGDYEKAITAYEKVLAEEPMHTGSLIAMGDVKVQQQELDEAVVYFEKAIDQTDDEIIPYNVAEIYFDRGETDKAIELYKRAAERKPDWQDPQLKLAYAHMNKGDMDSARTALEACVAIAPDTVQGRTAAQMLQSPAFAN